MEAVAAHLLAPQSSPHSKANLPAPNVTSMINESVRHGSFPFEKKMTVHAFRHRRSKAKCISPSQLHEVEALNLQIFNIRTNILLTIF